MYIFKSFLFRIRIKESTFYVPILNIYVYKISPLHQFLQGPPFLRKYYKTELFCCASTFEINVLILPIQPAYSVEPQGGGGGGGGYSDFFIHT